MSYQHYTLPGRPSHNEQQFPVREAVEMIFDAESEIEEMKTY